MQKTKDFLQDLQQNLFVKCFTDDLITLKVLSLYLSLNYISVKNLNVG